MNMQVEFTRHFWLRWEKRKEDMLRNGVTPETINKGREWRVKKVGDRCLRIVAQAQRDRLEIIRAFFDRTLKRKGLCG